MTDTPAPLPPYPPSTVNEEDRRYKRIMIPGAFRGSFVESNETRAVIDEWMLWAHHDILCARKTEPSEAEKQAFIDALNGTEATHGKPYLSVNAHLGCRYLLDSACENGHHWAIEALLKAGADPNQSIFEQTAFGRAVKAGDVEAVRVLMENPHGEKAKFGSTKEEEALHVKVARNDDLKMLKFLHEQGFDFSGKEKNSSNALHAAAKAGSIKSVRWLLNNVVGTKEDGKPIRIDATTAGHSALDEITLSEPHPEDKRIAKLLLKKGVGFGKDSVIYARLNMCMPVLEAMLEHDPKKTTRILRELDAMKKLDVDSSVNKYEVVQFGQRSTNAHLDKDSPFVKMAEFLVGIGMDVNDIPAENLQSIFAQPLPHTYMALRALGFNPTQHILVDDLGRNGTQRIRTFVHRYFADVKLETEEQIAMHDDLCGAIGEIAQPGIRPIQPGEVCLLDDIYEQKAIAEGTLDGIPAIRPSVALSFPGKSPNDYWAQPYWRNAEHAKEALRAMDALGSDWRAKHQAIYQRMEGAANNRWADRVSGSRNGWERGARR